MELVETIREFLVEVIRPIVEEAVKSATPKPELPKDKKYITLKQAYKEYQLTSSSVYRKFETGKLHKFKNGSRTLLDVNEVESLFKKEKMAGIVDESRRFRTSRS